MEIGVGEDHLSVFLRRVGQPGLEYRTVVFAHDVAPGMVRTEEKNGLYRIVVPKTNNSR